ncbi:MAG TPA: hypothetical protein DCZ72_05655 [Armatimonadetes bacterium]|nr:hypothetical protein [Armatimonadota bacterium]
MTNQQQPATRDAPNGTKPGGSGRLNPNRLRQFYQQSALESEDAAQRLMSLGVGFSACALLFTLPLLTSMWAQIWLGAWTALTAGALFSRRRNAAALRRALLSNQLARIAPLEPAIWERLAELRHIPAPIDAYIAHFLGTYVEFKAQVREDDKVELGQAQLLQAQEHVLDFLDLAERTGTIRHVLDTMSHRISDEDQIRLRQRFSEQCAGLQQISQSFDRGLGNLVVAQVLSDDLGETTMDYMQERMQAIEDEFAEVKDTLDGVSL